MRNEKGTYTLRGPGSAPLSIAEDRERDSEQTFWQQGGCVCLGAIIMADFYEVWRCRGPVLEKLAAMVDAREAAREEELKAATDIKRVYRGKVHTTVFTVQCFDNKYLPLV